MTQHQTETGSQALETKQIIRIEIYRNQKKDSHGISRWQKVEERNKAIPDSATENLSLDLSQSVFLSLGLGLDLSLALCFFESCPK